MRLLRIFLVIFAVASFGVALLFHWRLGWPWIIGWLIGANVSAFCLWTYDKRQAMNQRLRVPEMALHAMALAGATPASFLAMGLLRHKNLKMHFTILYAVFLVIQVAAAGMLWVMP
jgi:uncharacterized membrane protein YsdA (DUF1294 family)